MDKKKENCTCEKCFIIMPISNQGEYSEGHFTKVYEQIIKPAVENCGYEAYRVDEDKISNSIINKIFEAIQNCPMAICDLSNRNPNVLYELGLRQAYDKPVVLIQDDKTERIFDVSGISTVTYRSNRLYENVMEDRKKIEEAIEATKEGKSNSLMMIVKAEAANISLENINQDDKVSIMLNSIMTEVQELKTNIRNNNLETQNINMDKKIKQSFYKDLELVEGEKEYLSFIIILKSGITDKEILYILKKFDQKKYPCKWRREKNNLYVYIPLEIAATNIGMIYTHLSKLGTVRRLSE